MLSKRSKKPKSDHGPFAYLLTKDALERTKKVRFGDQINKRKFNTFAALSGVFAVSLLISLYVASIFFPMGAPLFFGNPLHPPAVDAYEFKVTPGSMTVPRGSDVVVQAVAMGFDPQRAEIHMRFSNSTNWEASTMEVSPQNVPTFKHLIFQSSGAGALFRGSGRVSSRRNSRSMLQIFRVSRSSTIHTTIPPIRAWRLRRKRTHPTWWR